MPSAYFHREYLYDALLRPWRVSTHIPAGGANSWTEHTFTRDSAYDDYYGRPKATSYPGGEVVRLDYDSRGNPLGETQLGTDGSVGTTYRQVCQMSLRGQVTLQTFANNVAESNAYDDSTGMPLDMNAFKMQASQGRCPALPSSAQLVREVDYTYDHFLNVARQAKQFPPAAGETLGEAATETYQYDELQRLLTASRSWTNLTPNPATVASDAFTYDDLGNIKSKSDYGDSYLYGSAARAAPSLAGPDAVTSVTKGGVTRPTFTYDKNGNMVTGDGRSVAFDNLDRAITVTANGYTTQFRYAPDGQRYVQSATSAAGTTNEYYDDKLYERVESALSPVERNYVSDSVMIVRTGATRAARYRHLDRLGSLDAVTREDGSEDASDAHGFDVFGKPRPRDFQSTADINSWQMQPTDNTYVTERGFTGHEHLDDLYLIHMNGRVYDYRLGRFLSVDPIISNPANSQSLNPYSYVGNNPLSGVDPTGYAEQTLSGPGGCTLMTGSHICNTAGAGDNLWVSGLPVIGGRLSPASTTSSGAAPGTATSPHGAPNGGANETGSPRQTATSQTGQQVPGTTWGRDASGKEYSTSWATFVADHQITAFPNAVLAEMAYGALDWYNRLVHGTPAPPEAIQAERNPDLWRSPAFPFLHDNLPLLAAIIIGAVTNEPLTGELPPANAGPSFVVTPNGEVIPVPRGASGPVPVINAAGKTTGFAFTDGSGGAGLDARVSSVRIMDPTPARGPQPASPGGYVNYANSAGQSVNPATGRTIAPSDPAWHIPLRDQ